MSEPLRIAFAGDRDISVRVLDFLIEEGVRPAALIVSEPGRASHAEEMVARCDHLDPDYVLAGEAFRAVPAVEVLNSLALDLVVSVHFPYVVPPDVLRVPRLGWLNLHPGFLPWNRGWHTATWAMMEETPVGATLHFMDEDLDAGDIVRQRQLDIGPGDTADSLYSRLLDLELEVFKEAWPRLMDGTYERTPQKDEAGSSHSRRDLDTPQVQRLDLEADVVTGDLLRRIRALTTNHIDEAAYYEIDSTRYRIRLDVTEEPIEGGTDKPRS